MRSNALTRGFLACRPQLTVVAVFSAFLNVLYLAPTLYMLQVYDRVLPTSGGVTLIMVSVILLIALVTLTSLDWVRSRLMVRCGVRLDRELAGPIIREVLSQRKLSRIDRTRMVRDFDTLRGVMSGGAALALFDLPWMVIYVAAAFLLHPALGALCIVGCGVMLALACVNESISGQSMSEANKVSAVAYARQDQVSSSAAEVRALGMIEAMTAKQLSDRALVAGLQTRAGFASGHITAGMKLLRLSLQSAALGLAAWLAIKGQISAGALMAASFLLARAVGPMEQVVGSWKAIVQSRDAYRSLHALLAASTSGTTRTVLPAPKGDLSLEDVTIVPPHSDRPTLINIDLSIRAGEMIGVVGASGSGKSTLIRALAGALEPVAGVVRFDGASRMDWDSERLGRYVGYLPQDSILFTGSIKENIARFQTDPTPGVIDKQVVEAAQAAGVHEIILRLPQGYETPMGLGGVGLSGGQVQRIALARALYGKPRVLLLDEPNSHLDAEGEQVLCEALRRAKAEGVTIVIAAHRGAVLAGADKVLVLADGRVQSFGSLADTAATMRAHNPRPRKTAERNAP